MATSPAAEQLLELLHQSLDLAAQIPWHLWLVIIFSLFIVIAALIYTVVFVLAPSPRAPLRIEEEYVTCLPNGQVTKPEKLPCWQYTHLASKEVYKKTDNYVEPAEVFMSLVVPAYNEQERIKPMLEEAITFLRSEYGASETSADAVKANSTLKQRNGQANGARHQGSDARGWEILVVSDGSTDKTGDVVLDFARRYPEGSIRLVTLARNRGKGGAVTHGMRHVRGQYAVFADADGASKFEDLRKLVAASQPAEDELGRVVAVGSRAHLVGSEAVVKRSKLRNFLMHSFHLLLWVLTPPATSRIKDTQCGFKMFSRPALPYIIPHMHSEGWIFDVEMLMLAEAAKIPMVEVPIGWKEVTGSKLNVIWDSLGMAYGLALLRAAWAIGVYRV